MPNTKVFRVLIGEQQSFYVDTEAMSADEAMEKVRARLLDPHDDVQPIEDNGAYQGYQVEDAMEIDREDANLDV
jgi:hypothetical protein